ncbi:PEGA domain-containing protein [bacterium]|nr:PEGA domain-containing protein [bacterium]
MDATEAINKGEEAYPSLTILSGPDEGLFIALTGKEQVIGRSRRSASILLEDTSVSRVHARITSKDGNFFVTDMESRNGVALNGNRIKPNSETPLKHLDQIKVGLYILRFNERKPTSEEAAKSTVYSDIPLPKKKENPSAFDDITISDKVPEEPKPIAPVPEVAPESVKKEEEVLPPQTEAATEAKEAEEILNSLPIEEGVVASEDAVSLEEESYGKGIRNVFIIISVICALTGLVYFLSHGFSQKKKENVEALETPPEVTAINTEDVEKHLEVPEAVKPEELKAPEETQPAAQEANAPAPTIQTPPDVVTPPANTIENVPVVNSQPQVLPPSSADERTMNFILDLQTQPMPARVYFNDQDLGQSPVKAPLQLKPGVSYSVVANFDLPDLNDQYQYRASFTPDASKEVITLNVSPDIGLMKVMLLPRDVDFYMEGYYAYDKEKAHPVKLTNIIYGKPVYVPFGHYVIELKERVKVGDTDTYVSEVRYHREIDINADNRTVELSVKERDIQFFPARITSEPSGAQVFLDGKQVGKTPYAGELPLGRHDLKLTLDGYFDNDSTLDMRVNSPYEAKIVMKTSKVGQMIAKAKEEKQNGQYQDAINNLIEALKIGGSDKEKADIRILLGDSYYLMGDYDRAFSFYEEMAAETPYRYRALLGKARILNIRGDKQGSLRLLSEIFLNLTPQDPLLNEAASLFKQLSPLKSVMYITTEPKGATVMVNGRDMGQKSPVLLFDLGFGNYRIELSKPGFQSAQVQKNLKVSEFVPVVVKLKPDSL